METEDELRRALGELATLFIRIGKAVAQQGFPFVDAFYAALCNVTGKDTVDALLFAMQEYRIPVSQGITDESFDSCVHCKAIAESPGEVPRDAHADTCPVIIDVWPVDWQDIVGELTCESCAAPFNLGEFYMTLPAIRCLPCVFVEGVRRDA